VRPTALGVKAALFYLLLVAAFFAAPYANLFFLLLVFLTVLGLAGLFATRRNLAGVTGEIEPIEPAPAGTVAPFHARLDGGERARFALTVAIDLDGREPASLTVPALRGEVRATGSLPALPRGVYRLRRARVASGWPLGLLVARHPLPAPVELIVYPAPTELATTRGGGGGVGELYDALGAADGFLQPSNLREYRPGDELRLGHWKASARRHELVIKEWEGGTGSGHEVVLERRVEPAALEEALGTVSALARAAREQKELLTVHSQGLSATFGADHRPWTDLLRFLAEAEPLPPGAEPPPAVSPAILRLPRPQGGAA